MRILRPANVHDRRALRRLRRHASGLASACLAAAAALLAAAQGCGCNAQPDPVPLPDAPVREALDRRVSVDYHETPLTDVLADLSRQAGVAIWWDEDDLAANAWLPFHDLAIILRARDVSLRSALRLALGQHELSYLMRRDGLQVVPPDQVKDPEEFTTQVYPVSALISGDEEETYWDQDLAWELAQLVERDSWDDVGGDGHIEGAPGALLIAQSQAEHEQIEQVFAACRSMLSATGNHARRSPSTTQGPPPGQGRGRREPWPSFGMRGTLVDVESPSVAAIRAALERPVSLDVRDKPLDVVLTDLAEEVGANLVIDQRSLEDAGVATERPRNAGAGFRAAAGSARLPAPPARPHVDRAG
jgi:hypothetical protein